MTTLALVAARLDAIRQRLTEAIAANQPTGHLGADLQAVVDDLDALRGALSDAGPAPATAADDV